MTLERALAVIEAARRKAEEIGVPMNVAQAGADAF